MRLLRLAHNDTRKDSLSLQRAKRDVVISGGPEFFARACPRSWPWALLHCPAKEQRGHLIGRSRRQRGNLNLYESTSQGLIEFAYTFEAV
jgi:hypothetical protein